MSVAAASAVLVAEIATAVATACCGVSQFKRTRSTDKAVIAAKASDDSMYCVRTILTPLTLRLRCFNLLLFSRLVLI